MTREEIAEAIAALPILDQAMIAAEVVARVAPRFGLGQVVRQTRRLHMAAAAEEAAEWYRTDPELTIWTTLDGEPVYEYCDDFPIDDPSQTPGKPGAI